jgi:lipopolysaccharide transport system permease protein/teichoic acid transport system permease protein
MLRSFFFFIKLILSQRQLILDLAKRDLANQYVGSLLGFIWTFINPLFMIFIFWVVFSLGFRVQPMNDVPFVVWLTAGLSVWFLFSDIVNGSSVLILANAHLIKKTVFQSQILPVIKVVSCLVTHSIFLLVLMGLIGFNKMPFSVYYLQFVYYLFCTSVLALGISWFVSALNVFIRDVGQVVALSLQMGFWATPIFWDVQILPPKIQTFFELNPMYYIVQGYRDTFIYFVPFWSHPMQSLYFWIVSLTWFICGALVFKKLKPQFPDVL